jgi:hypothetical protein
VKNIIPEGFAERLIADGLRSAEDALAQQIGTGIELQGRRKDGSEFPIEIMLSPLESRRRNSGDSRDPRHQPRAKMPKRHLLRNMARAQPLERGTGAIRLHRLARFARAAAHGGQLHAASFQDDIKGKLDADADEFIAYRSRWGQPHAGLIQDLLAYSRAGVKWPDSASHRLRSEDVLEVALIELYERH